MVASKHEHAHAHAKAKASDNKLRFVHNAAGFGKAGKTIHDKMQYVHNAAGHGDVKLADKGANHENTIHKLGNDNKLHFIHNAAGFGKDKTLDKGAAGGRKTLNKVSADGKKTNFIHNAAGFAKDKTLDKAAAGGRKTLNKVSADGKKTNFIHNAAGFGDKAAAPIAQKDSNVVTVVSQVYVTEPKTFDGPAVYITQSTPGPVAPAATTPAVEPSASQNSYESAKSAAHQPHSRKPVASGSHSAAGTHLKGSPLQATPAPTGAQAQSSESSQSELIGHKSHGMSSGSKAGVALGVLLAIGLCAGLVLFYLRRRRQQMENGEKLDEKHQSKGSFFGGTSAAFTTPSETTNNASTANNRTGSTAPRLSLRPASLLPNLMAMGQSNNNAQAMSEKPRSGWDRNPQDPFTDAAILSEKQARPESPPANPFEDSEAAAAQRPTTPNHSHTNSVTGDEPGTPNSVQLGTAAAVSMTGAAGAAPPRGPNNVHRVQLDFKPSMDDELELKSGQLVRMLHAYDDGWALCIRMDRTQQGVCPRTCLSKLPVKPRPNGPGGSPPNGPMPARPAGPPPSGTRGPPPQAINKMMPRPLTPTGRERSATAGAGSAPVIEELSRNRSQSVSAAADMDRPVSPIETGVVARKPVPGQAL